MIYPTISAHASSTCDICVLFGHPSKLSPEQQLLGFLLHMKHDPIAALLVFYWIWCKSSVIDD